MSACGLGRMASRTDLGWCGHGRRGGEEREKGPSANVFRLFFVSFDGVGKRG